MSCGILHGKRIGFVGGGNMAEALLRGLAQSGAVGEGGLLVHDIEVSRMELLARECGASAMTDNIHLVENCDVVVLAVKPQVWARVTEGFAPALSERHLLVSIVAGVAVSDLRGASGGRSRVIRVIPNTPALVAEGMTAIAAPEGGTASGGDLAVARAVFETVGRVAVVPEKLLDAATGLSGSGPAYVFLILEALADGGVMMGLPRREAYEMAAQTLLGAAKLHLATRTGPGALKDMVTSPGGTTIRGLHELEKAGVRAALMNAVEAATLRSVELGKMK